MFSSQFGIDATHGLLKRSKAECRSVPSSQVPVKPTSPRTPRATPPLWAKGDLKVSGYPDDVKCTQKQDPVADPESGGRQESETAVGERGLHVQRSSSICQPAQTLYRPRLAIRTLKKGCCSRWHLTRGSCPHVQIPGLRGSVSERPDQIWLKMSRGCDGWSKRQSTSPVSDRQSTATEG
jgi:hypothetical protein